MTDPCKYDRFNIHDYDIGDDEIDDPIETDEEYVVRQEDMIVESPYQEES